MPPRFGCTADSLNDRVRDCIYVVLCIGEARRPLFAGLKPRQARELY